mmetsp:Transcript_26480/g.41221  ORF Transcript_26480/g.41221 Transcript_26480/m.41221 type:complete len:209 (-) Transcript_26480:28-654(-)
MVRAIGIRRKEDGFIAVDDSAFREIDRPGSPMHEICQWCGVRCNSSGTVQSVVWRDYTLHYLYLGWLPSTIQAIDIRGQKGAGKDEFDTRQIPKSAVDVYILGSDFQGTIDVYGLTDVIQWLALPCNCISGRVLVGFLPPNLKVLNMMSNPIDAVIVDNESLPEAFIRGSFGQEKRIRKIEVGGRTVDKRVEVKKLDYRGRYLKVRTV